MNKQTVTYLEEKEQLRLNTIVELTKNTDMSFKEAEEILDAMVTEALNPININNLSEVAVDKNIKL